MFACHDSGNANQFAGTAAPTHTGTHYVPCSRTIIEGMFSPHARMCTPRALRGLACCAHVTPATSHALPCSSEARVPRLRLCQSSSHTFFGTCHMEKTYCVDGAPISQHTLAEPLTASANAGPLMILSCTNCIVAAESSSEQCPAASSMHAFMYTQSHTEQRARHTSLARLNVLAQVLPG